VNLEWGVPKMIRVYQNVPGVLVFPAEQPPASRKLLGAVSEFLRGITDLGDMLTCS
jgi:hypothetical protein